MQQKVFLARARMGDQHALKKLPADQDVTNVVQTTGLEDTRLEDPIISGSPVHDPPEIIMQEVEPPVRSRKSKRKRCEHVVYVSATTCPAAFGFDNDIATTATAFVCLSNKQFLAPLLLSCPTYLCCTHDLYHTGCLATGVSQVKQ